MKILALEFYKNGEMKEAFALGGSLENHGHDGSLIYKSFALYFPSEDMSLAVQQNDDRLQALGSTGDPFDLFYLSLALLDTYLNYSAPSSTGDLTRTFENLTVTPNPADDVTRIDFKLTTSSHIRVTVGRMDGGAVQSTDFGLLEAGPHELELSLGDMPSGMYLLSLHDRDQRIQKILVIQ